MKTEDLSPLLRRSSLLPGESVPSLVFRLVDLNYCKPLNLISRLCLSGSKDKQFERPSQGIVLERLAMLNKMSPIELYAATTHCFAEIITPPDVTTSHLKLGDKNMPALTEGIANRHVRPSPTGQFCPLCLAETPYHRLAWLPVVLSVCLKHHCILLDCCPNCRKPVSIRSIVGKQCSHCKAELTEAAVTTIDENELTAQQYIQSWLKVAPSPNQQCHLPDQPPQVLYRLLDGLRLSLMSHNTAWRNFPRLDGLPTFDKGEKLTPSQSLALYTTVFEGLCNWPSGLHAFLQMFTEAAPSKSLKNDLRSLYTQWFQYRWKGPQWRFLQDAFSEYLVNYYPASVLQLNRLQSNSDLYDKFRYTLLNEVVKQLGLSDSVILDMVKLGLLAAQTENAYWLFEKQSIEDFWQKMKHHTESLPRPEFTIDLPTAAKMTSRVGLNGAGLLGLVAEGQLLACWPSTHLNDLRFTEAGLQEQIEEIQLKQQWLRREDVAVRMGVKVEVVAKWVKIGLFRPVASYANTLYFDRQQLDIFAREYVFSDEAAQILGVGLDVVQKWARKGRLKPVAGGDNVCHRYLFCREELERLSPERRLTGPQLARRLGLSRSQLWVHIKQGKVKPISGPGIDGSKHYLFAIPTEDSLTSL